MQYPRIGEALVRGERHRLSAAEPELIIGDLNGPVGTAFATLLGGQVEGHTRVLALLNGDVAVKPATGGWTAATTQSGIVRVCVPCGPVTVSVTV